jgi:hypothetical protein
MKSDIEARDINTGADIGLNAIRTYHSETFAIVANLPPETWTA